MPWFYSIRWKLALSYIALSVVPLLIFNFTIMSLIRDYYMNERISEIQENANVMSGIVASSGFDDLVAGNPNLLFFRQTVNERRDDWGVRIIVTNDAAYVIADSSAGTRLSLLSTTLTRPEIISALNREDSFSIREQERTVNVAKTVHDEASGRIGAVLLTQSVDDIFDSLDEIRTTLLLYTMAVGLVVIVLIFVVSNSLIHPLQRTLKVVERMTDGKLNLRIPDKGNDEYAILARAFNAMSEKLEAVERTREEFVSNVSHELKTPLSSIKVLSESILLHESVPEEVYREFLHDINSEVDRMTNINNDLLALVKIDQREQSMNIQQTNINQLVEDILKRLSPLAEQKKIALIYEEVRPVAIDADEIKLTLAISNIIENGIKYTPSGGTVKVVVDSDHQFAFITIQDTGVGIPEDEQDKIFNRFYRVDKTRDRETGGTGLGLAISRSTVLLHNGSIRVNSKPGEGSVFILRIPIRRV